MTVASAARAFAFGEAQRVISSRFPSRKYGRFRSKASGNGWFVDAALEDALAPAGRRRRRRADAGCTRS